MSGERTGRYTGRVDLSYLDAPEFLGKTAVSADERLRIPVSETPSRRQRVSQQQLDQLKTRLSDRDLDLLQLLKKFRLINTDQIRAHLFADHASQATAQRVARRCLARLSEQGLVERLGQRVGGIKAGASAVVWTLTPLGHRLLGQSNRKSRYQPSITHIRHTLAIAQLAADLTEHARHHQLELSTVTEPDCWRAYSTHQPVLKPDLHASLADEHEELVWWIEVDRGTESSTVIERKLRSYSTYFDTGIEQAAAGVFPLTLWIAPEAHRANQLRQIIANARNIEPRLFRVCTPEQAIDVLADFGGDDQRAERAQRADRVERVERDDRAIDQTPSSPEKPAPHDTAPEHKS